MMDLKKYMEQAATTAAFDTDKFGMLEMYYVSSGLAGEAGEVSNQVKKIWRDDDSEPTEKRKQALFKELGDVLWYWVMNCKMLGFDPNEVAQANLDKLLKRLKENKIHGDGDNR
jgi:NTP pyrophosphatase (non-canonical NTP hydrolase)